MLLPYGRFYVTLDFNNLKDKLFNKGIKTAEDLSQALLSKLYYIALVTGKSIAITNDVFIARITFIDYNGEEIFH